MPLILKENISSHSCYFVWSVTEDESYFKERLSLDDFETTYLEKLKGAKRTEFLAGRFLLHHAIGSEKRLFLDIEASGKPQLKDRNKEISLSHSSEYVSAILSDRLVGIDIQAYSPKLERIQKKFISEEEYEWYKEEMNVDYIHHFWGAKEALFKAYGKGKVEFRTDLKITSLPDELEKGTGTAKVIKEDLKADFRIYSRKLDNYFIAIAEQK